MDWIGWGFLVVAVVVAFFLIRALMQVSRTMGNLGVLINSLEKEITPLLRELRETSERVTCLLAQTQERLNQMETLFMTLRESAQIFSLINRIMRGGVTSSLMNLAGLAAGLKTAGKTLLKLKGKGGK